MNDIIYFILVLLIIYKDSPLALIIGSSGYTFLPPISIIMFIQLLCSKKGKIKVSGFCLNIYKMLLYLSVVSFVSIALWLLFGNGLIVLEENIIIKTLKNLLNFFAIFCFCFSMYEYLRQMSDERILSPFFGVLIIMMIICVLESKLIPHAFDFLHFSGRIPYSRIRLLTKESSWTASLILIYYILSLHFGVYVKKSKTIVLISTICFLILLYYTSSKTLLVSIFIFLGVLMLSNIKKANRKRLMLSGIVLIILIASSVLLLPTIQNAFVASMQWSSVVTRTYTILIGAIIGIVYPFGVGMAVYLSIFQQFLNKYFYLMDYFPHLTDQNLKEIIGYIYATNDTALSVKAGLMQYHMYWGILGTAYILFAIYKNIIKKLGVHRECILIKTGVIVVTILTYTSIELTYEYLLFLIISVVIGERIESSKSAK